MPTPYKSTQPLDAWKRPSARPSVRREPHARADRGSPWAWVIVVALALAVTGWWLALVQNDEGSSSDRTTTSTPKVDPPRPQPAH
ncbi:hypothetical protein [Xanthomonas indica]|uniref:Uncharacterized protein n=1 Tax=Xanthomonas indica TaxID=2912242 RepID=A0AAU8I1R4_9XANT|nr:hypothetical protein [Xanthomonas indica]MCI2260923.1 hypothetical protein [Xanthomonas indica]